MNFNVNELLSSLSYGLDFVEKDLMSNVTNHGRRVAYIASRIGQKLNLSDKRLVDLISYSLLHDCGVTRALLHTSTEMDYRKAELTHLHCMEGERIIEVFPFFEPVKKVILYHHECYDGSGHFGIAGEKIPFYSRIIALADFVAIEYSEGVHYKSILRAVKSKQGSFDPQLAELLFELGKNIEFWLSMDDAFVSDALKRNMPCLIQNLNYRDMRFVSQIFSRIIDAKSPFTGKHSREISEKTGLLCRYYRYDEDQYWQMRIAADLHDLGKLMVPNSILDKPASLTPEEIAVIQSHTFYTRRALEKISGFENITEWAANHHEKLNGSGYPYGFSEDRLDFNSRILACVDIYQALTEDRPYRPALPHDKALQVLHKMAQQHLIDGGIVEDVNAVFGNMWNEKGA